ncbi:MAG: ArsR family transcriptional regulator [Gammaproteobacteria bacterium]|nr:MAG: ArsR family transcriptional regulator [Gammaproteobacteria bacterium]
MLDAFNGIITSKMKVRLLMRLFLDPSLQSYVRELADEMDVSPSQVKTELDNLNKAGLLESEKYGRQIFYRANNKHPLFPELQSMVRKALGMDSILESIISRLGNLEQAFLIDDYAQGKDSGLIDLVLVGDIDKRNLDDLVSKTERYIERKIRVFTMTKKEYKKNIKIFEGRPVFPLYSK